MTNKRRPFNPHVANLKQSYIRSATQRCQQLGGINLGQGVCDIAAHHKIKQAAFDAITEDKNIYAESRGVAILRHKLAEKIAKFNHVDVNPDTEILVSHGSTGSYLAAAKVLFHPGDEVILFEPFYGYHKNMLAMFDVRVKTCQMDPHDFSIDFDALEKLITDQVKGIIICTPCNPNGKVFSREELTKIGDLAEKYNLYIITDEIYEYITYPGFEHVSIASLKDFKERTVTISGFSKTYNITGWRLGYAYGPADIIERMSHVHDLVYVCPVTPLQHAMVTALELEESHYQKMRDYFLAKRDYVVSALRAIGCKVVEPQGAYYLMVDCSALELGDDEAIANRFLEEAGVAVVPGRAFFADAAKGKSLVRVCYALDDHKLETAMTKLKQVFGKK